MRRKTTKLGGEDLGDDVEETKGKKKGETKGVDVKGGLLSKLGNAGKTELPLKSDQPSSKKDEKDLQPDELQKVKEVEKNDQKAADPTAQGKPEENKEKPAAVFEFETEKIYRSFKEETKEGQYKYAISKWQLNKGRHAV